MGLQLETCTAQYPASHACPQMARKQWWWRGSGREQEGKEESVTGKGYFLPSFLPASKCYCDQYTAGHPNPSKQKTRFPSPETLHVGRVDRQSCKQYFIVIKCSEVHKTGSHVRGRERAIWTEHSWGSDILRPDSWENNSFPGPLQGKMLKD